MLGANLQRTCIRAGGGGSSLAKSTVINSPRHFSLFGKLERYFPFQMPSEIRSLKSRWETLLPSPVNARSLCRGAEEKRARFVAEVKAEVHAGWDGDCFQRRLHSSSRMLSRGPNYCKNPNTWWCKAVALGGEARGLLYG